MFDLTETMTGGSLSAPEENNRNEKEDSPDLLAKGVTIGRYVVLERLGLGGMGAVYSAFDPELERVVALKMVRPDLRSGEKARRRLIREAKTAARLSHPNVVQIHDAGTVGDYFFLAMERIEGQNLAHVLAKDGLGWREILRLFLAAGEGLQAAHAAGLVHRDFKPSNVMVSESGRVAVVDFGLAQWADLSEGNDALEPPTTVEPRIGGTPAYMSPEQRRGAEVDARSDQYSFCAALHQALFGRLPSSGRDGDPPNSDIENRFEIPGRVRNVVSRGLAQDPDDRFQDLGDLLDALRQDPARRFRRIGLVAATAAFMAFTGWLAYRAGAVQVVTCGEAASKLDGVWDAGRKTILQEAMLGSDLPFADASWQFVESRFDDYAHHWTQAHISACEQAQRGLQTEGLADLQIACLDTRKLDLEAAVALLSDGQPEVIRRAQSVARLPALAGCLDRTVLAHQEPPPADADIARGVEQVRRELADLRSRASAGQSRALLAEARSLVERADAFHYRPLGAEARLVAGAAVGFAGLFDESKRDFMESVELAMASRHDEVLARALLSLTVLNRMAGDLEASRTWAGLSEAAVLRMGDRPDLRADHEFTLGMVSALEGHWQQAIEHYRTFLEYPDDDTSHHPRHAHHNISKAYANLGDYDAATAALDRSLALSKLELGEVHPSLVATLEMHSSLNQRQGQYGQALEFAERALDMLDQLQAETFNKLPLRSRRAQILLELERFSEALAGIEHVLADYEANRAAGGRPHPVHVADARFILAQALAEDLGVNGLARARSAANEALRTFHDAGKKDKAADVEAWLTSTATTLEDET